ncbi:MAG: hypothetical protein RL094_144 [Candidatus Parcubacteria bacterium]|jgi:RNA polymerase-binding transcription factor DksA
MALDISNYKAKLETHKKALEQVLGLVGEKNPTNKDEWIPVQTEVGEDTADRSEVAEAITDFDSNAAVLTQLETELFAVNHALDRIEAGTYGICAVCNKEIEEDRLNANTSARTCIEHKDEPLI